MRMGTKKGCRERKEEGEGREWDGGNEWRE